MFALHERLKADTLPVFESALSSVLLMNNSHFPWLILVPHQSGAREITDLNPNDRYRLMDEIAFASKTLQTLFSPDKINVAALGNQVPMLHIHIIARFTRDAAWPNPVWGNVSAPYGDPSQIILQIQTIYKNA